MEPHVWEPFTPLSSLFRGMDGFGVKVCQGHGFWFCHVSSHDGPASPTTSLGGGAVQPLYTKTTFQDLDGSICWILSSMVYFSQLPIFQWTRRGLRALQTSLFLPKIPA